MDKLPTIGIPLSMKAQKIEIVEGQIPQILNLLTAFTEALPNAPQIYYLHFPTLKTLIILNKDKTLLKINIL